MPGPGDTGDMKIRVVPALVRFVDSGTEISPSFIYHSLVLSLPKTLIKIIIDACVIPSLTKIKGNVQVVSRPKVVVRTRLRGWED